MRRALSLASLITPSLLLAFILGPILAQAEFVGKVIGVIDGDSIRVMHDGKAEPVRLLGIDHGRLRMVVPKVREGSAVE